jgi:tripartite-type tricarboxylate transporter receptor subunit TctC
MDVAGGHTDLLLDSMISLMQMAKVGKVKRIAITSFKRSSRMPDVWRRRRSSGPTSQPR